MTEIGQKIIAKVREIASADPDFIYRSPTGAACLYVHKGEPSCLIGQALWQLGLIDGEIESAPSVLVAGRSFTTQPNKAWVTDLLPHLDILVSESEGKWLKTVQDRQDDLHPWGMAIEVADLQVANCG